jgi:hypothetical protein
VLGSAALAILKPGFVEVVNHPWPYLASSRRMQDFSLRANTVVLLRRIEKCARRKPLRQTVKVALSVGPTKGRGIVKALEASGFGLAQERSCTVLRTGEFRMRPPASLETFKI